mmetsp:Transcript_15289/g.50222  ORF Transcript_15289/g.50222 Transcript_15289/m.50222 type:complete len:294 (-) Transcript_15289:636-1517(-)
MRAALSLSRQLVGPRSLNRTSRPQRQQQRRIAATPRAEVDMQAFLRMMMADKLKMVSPNDALPGRDQALPITDKHYVLKNPIKELAPGMEECLFATGCFWGTEKMFWRIPGVVSTAVIYVAGYTKNPTYEEVCSGQTGHTEGVRVVYDPTKITFPDLLALFWTSHDPTQGMAQGNDTGTQYRSGLYAKTQEQYELAMASKDAYQKALGSRFGEITTEIKGPNEDVLMYYAEDYHQQYLAKPGSRPYCSAQPSGVPMDPSWLAENGAVLSPAFWLQYGPRPGCTIQTPNEQIVA